MSKVLIPSSGQVSEFIVELIKKGVPFEIETPSINSSEFRKYIFTFSRVKNQELEYSIFEFTASGTYGEYDCSYMNKFESVDEIFNWKFNND